MAEGMEVEQSPGPTVRDKKRFEVKKVRETALRVDTYTYAPVR